MIGRTPGQPELSGSEQSDADAGSSLDVNSRISYALEILGPLAEGNAPLGEKTTYRVGGRSAIGTTIESEADLALLKQAIGKSGLSVLVVGRGSNMLVSDHGWSGIAISLGPAFSNMSILDVSEDVIDSRNGECAVAIVQVGAAQSLPVLARQSAALGWRGLEWAVGIPGSVGGAVRMNAGGHGSDVNAHLIEADVVNLSTGQRKWHSANELNLGFRRSNLSSDDLVLAARFKVRSGDPGQAMAEIEGVVRWRREHQPGGRNAGSFFKNPPEVSAGRLIERAGCKGMRFGTAQVSIKHANFIVADQGGSSEDVATLARLIRDRVHADCGVTLEPEVRFIGFDSLWT